MKSPATFSKLRRWILNKFQRAADWLWGYDYFISYHWHSGGKYAVGLFNSLHERGFDCFLDRSEFAAGDDWKQQAARALQNTQRLVVIATREAISGSDAVAHEIEVFSQRSRHIVPIFFEYPSHEGGASASTAMNGISNSVLRLSDSSNTLDTGIPNRETVVQRLIAADRILRRRKLRQSIIGTTILLLVLAIAGVSYYGYQTNLAKLAAEQSTMEARIATEKAIGAQNFAEYHRVIQKASTPGVDPEEKRALEAIAPKYLEQSHTRLIQATSLKNDLDQWKARYAPDPGSTGQLLSLEVIPTTPSGTVLVHFGKPSEPKYVLIDGGNAQGYGRSVKPVLQRISGGKPLTLDLVVSSQIDDQQMGGLAEMTWELVEAKSSGEAAPWLSIRDLWTNTFYPYLSNGSQPVVAYPKSKLIVAAHTLGIEVNRPFGKWIAVPASGAARVHRDNHLDITVLAPKADSLGKFAKYWLQNSESRIRELSPFSEGSSLEVLHSVPDLVESFEDRAIELIPSPILPVENIVGGGSDVSVANLASIVMMMESGGKRLLFTADTTATILLHTLGQAGYLDSNGHCDVDLLVLPHDGSDRNVSAEFFSSVTAREYLALGSGMYTNPEIKTFQWLFDSRRNLSEPFTIYLTSSPRDFKAGYPYEELIALFKKERRGGLPFKVMHPREVGTPFPIHLLQTQAAIPGALVEMDLH